MLVALWLPKWHDGANFLMPSGLFRDSTEDLILEIAYEGPSFDGRIEIGALAREVAGLQYIIESMTIAYSARGGLSIKATDLGIFVEPFREGSFKKKIRLVSRHVTRHQAIYNVLGTTVGNFLGVLTIVNTLGGSAVKEMTPATAAAIADQVKVKLLSDSHFLTSLADIVGPVQNPGDQFVTSSTIDGQVKEVKVTNEQKANFIALTDAPVLELQEGTLRESLKGQITRVTIDALKNDIGFKIEGQGPTIQASLPVGQEFSLEAMRSFLGQWVKIDAITKFVDSNRAHLDIQSYSIIRQGTFNDIRPE